MAASPRYSAHIEVVESISSSFRGSLERRLLHKLRNLLRAVDRNALYPI